MNIIQTKYTPAPPPDANTLKAGQLYRREPCEGDGSFWGAGIYVCVSYDEAYALINIATGSTYAGFLADATIPAGFVPVQAGTQYLIMARDAAEKEDV